MNLLIIEDEGPAARRLARMLEQLLPQANIFGPLQSIKESCDWLDNEPKPDLIFMDIELADGRSFEIFSKTEVTSPVIFTTAYQEFTLQAFKVNSVDYLLKPVDKEELNNAITKFKTVFQSRPGIPKQTIENLVNSLHKPSYKSRFLIKLGQTLTYISVTDINYFFAEDGAVFLLDKTGKKYLLDYTLDHLIEQLDPADWYRISRKIIISIHSISKIHTYFNSRLKLTLKPDIGLEAIVSRERVSDFKQWLDR